MCIIIHIFMYIVIIPLRKYDQKSKNKKCYIKNNFVMVLATSFVCMHIAKSLIIDIAS